MRIALIASSYLPVVGGLEWKVFFLASEYAALGHDVEVFAPRPARIYRRAIVPDPAGFKVHRCGYPARGMGKLAIIPLLMRWAVRRRQRDQHFDVIHCHPLGMPADVGVRSRVNRETVVVGTTSGADVARQTEAGGNERLPRGQFNQVRRSAARLDAIAVVSKAMRQAVADFGIDTRLVDIPNGVAWDAFQCGRSRHLHEKLAIDDRRLIVLSVGRFVETKNYVRAMKAFDKVRRAVPGSCYVIVGRDVPRLGDSVEARALGDDLRLVDQMPMAELPSIFHSADVYFNPSLAEGFSQANAQALASGLPLVITDAPGNVDAGDHGGALIARATDEEDMSSKLVSLLQDSSLRAELGAAAHAAGRRYAWTEIARSYIRLFEELLARRRSDGAPAQ